MSKKTIDDLLNFIDKTLSDAELKTALCLSNIANTISESRVSKKMNQKEFADALGVSQGLVSRWENGDYNFTVEKLIEIADKLDLDVNISFTHRIDAPSKTYCSGNIIDIRSVQHRTTSASKWSAVSTELKEM